MLKSVLKPLTGAALGVLTALVAFAPARAVPIAVTYSMNYQFFSPAAGQNVLVGPGTLNVFFANGTSLGHVGSGALHIASGTAMLNNTFTLLGGGIVLTGMQFDVFASGTGNVTGGGMFSLMTIGHIASGMLHCAGAFCGLAGFVSSMAVNLTSGPRTINIAAGQLLGFPSVGPQNFTVAGTGGMTPQGGVFAVTATGQEVSRGFVPEPSTGLLLGLGLAGFGIAGTTLRRWGRA